MLVMGLVSQRRLLVSTAVAPPSTTIVAMNTTGERLRATRERAGESQDDAARAAGVKKQAISKIELDHTVDPGARTMSRLARHYGVSVEWLLDGADSPSISLGSETMRLIPAKVAETAKALRKHYERRNLVFNIESEPERFVLAYAARTELPSEPTEDNLIEFGSKLEAIAPLSEGRGDGRANGVPADGKAGGNVAGGRSSNNA
jgi:transcriptional regulator with XRE-family HTH domain